MNSIRLPCLLVVLGLSTGALAQTTTTQPADGVAQIGAAGIDTELFIALILPTRTQFFARTPTSKLIAQPPLNGPVSLFAATRDALYAFSNGELYALRNDRWVPELNLPNRADPLELLGVGTDLYAIINSPPPGKLTRSETEKPGSTTRPFDPGAAPLSLVRYGTRGWTGVAGLPPDAGVDPSPRRHPKLGVIDGDLRIFWINREVARIDSAILDSARGAWTVAEPIALDRTPDGFWFASAGGVPCVVVATQTSETSSDVAAFRTLPGSSAGSAWRPTTLSFSTMPDGGEAKLYDVVFGFNQHLVFLALSAKDEAVLRFARLDGQPAEQTIVARDVFHRQNREEFTIHWVQTLTVAVLAATVFGLFVFRRGALVQTLLLPRGAEIAFTYQRLFGLAVDVAPFVYVASVITGVQWQAGLRQLVDWAIGLDPNRLPTTATLGWWALATGASAVYALIAELLAKRTVGKLVAGTRVLSESATTPNAQQIIIRNLLRFVELQPPMWVIGFLVLLSRNRQRLGDIAARTIVTRRVAVDQPPPEAPPS